MVLTNSFTDQLKTYLVKKSCTVMGDQNRSIIVKKGETNLEFEVNRVFGHLDVMFWNVSVAKKFTIENAEDYKEMIQFLESQV